MVVEEDCVATCLDKPLARAPLRRGRRASYVSQDTEFAANAGQRDYERQPNSPREFTIDLGSRDEPALRDSSKYCAFLGHNLVTV
jgi:hypothetical protein